MNWYRISQQMSFPFAKEVEEDPQYWDKRPNSQQSTLTYNDSFKDLMEEVNSEQELVNIFRHFKISYEKVMFKNNDWVYSYQIGKEYFVIDSGFYIKNAYDWIRDIVNSSEIFDIIDYTDFNKNFWDEVYDGYVLYHATTDENWESIKNNGLEPRDQTRGISNRDMGSAVFTSDNYESLSAYGDIIIQIDVGQMKKDGYMPTAVQESPVEEAEIERSLAWRLGIRDYEPEIDSSDGIWEDTIAFYGHIPAKYLKLVS
jgi:hypothetical protein